MRILLELGNGKVKNCINGKMAVETIFCENVSKKGRIYAINCFFYTFMFLLL
jgi:hypothetical protein